MKKTILEAILMAYSVPYPYFSLYPHQIPYFPIHPLKLQYMRRARNYLKNAFHLVLSPLYQNDDSQLQENGDQSGTKVELHRTKNSTNINTRMA